MAMDVAALKQKFEERKIKKVKVGGFDIDGVLRGKYLSLDKFWSIVGPGFGFCDVIFGWDIADVLYDNAKVTGWHTGYPDAHAVLDPSTLRDIPWEPGTVAMLADFRDERPRALERGLGAHGLQHRDLVTPQGGRSAPPPHPAGARAVRQTRGQAP